MTASYITKTAKDGAGNPFNAALQDQDGSGASVAGVHALRNAAGADINPSTSDLQTAANASLAQIVTNTAINPVGAGAIATAQATVGTSGAQIVAARTGALGTGRADVTIINYGAATIYVGLAGVTTSTGLPIPTNGSVTISSTAAIYGISASSGNIVGILETF